MSIISGTLQAIMGSKATEKAAETQAYSQDLATAATERMYAQEREDLAPWRKAGAEAVNQLSTKITAGPGEFQKSPYYDFLQKEGVKGLERGAAARGKQLSGGEQKALTQFGQDYANTAWQNWLSNWYQSLTPLQSMAGLGMTSAGQTAALGGQAAAQIGQNITAKGEAEAAGALGQGRIWGNLLTQQSNTGQQIGYNYLRNWAASPVAENAYVGAGGIWGSGAASNLEYFGGL